MPWYAPSNLAIFGFPVNTRAALMAFITASVPELQNRTLSMYSTRSTNREASSTSGSVGIAKEVPNSSCRVTASITSGFP